jgi:hypothetical protein
MSVHRLTVFAIRYLPNILREDGVTIGILVLEHGGNGFAAIRFIKDWNRLQAFSPDIDIEFLRAFAKEAVENVADIGKRGQFVRQMEESFSNQIQLAPRNDVSSDSPAEEMDRLAKYHLIF